MIEAEARAFEQLRQAVLHAEEAAAVHGERVVLVNDVFTTGATTGSCAKVLLSAGAQSVCVWTVARGI